MKTGTVRSVGGGGAGRDPARGQRLRPVWSRLALARWFNGALLGAGLLSVVPAYAATRYVWQDSPSPGPPYDTWATAAHVIQDAVDAAQTDDTILATNGIYASGGRAVSWLMTNRVAVTKALTVQSVNGPQFTIIQGAKAQGGGNGEGAIRWGGGHPVRVSSQRGSVEWLHVDAWGHAHLRGLHNAAER